MPSAPPLAYAVRRALLSLVVLSATAVLAACGGTPAPGGSSTPVPVPSTGPLRPVTSQRVEADGALACPPALADGQGLTVPEAPQGLDGNARLLPEDEPSSLVVCSYPVMVVTATAPLAAPFDIDRRAVPTGAKRSALVDLLSWAPRWNGRQRACTEMAGDETAYLLGARYDDATVWVAAKADANSCSRASNGDFVAGAPMGVSVRRLLAGTPDVGDPGPCGSRSWGRLGDERTLVPHGDPSVTVCRLAVDGTTRSTPLNAAQSRQVVGALRELATRPTEGYCQASGQRSDRVHRLVLTYPIGPDVRVDIDPGCAPPVRGAGVESDDVGAVLQLVEQWSPPIPGPDPNGSVSSDGAVAR